MGGGDCSKNIRKALDLARHLVILADKGEAHCKDDGCVALYGVIRDCAYKIRDSAERELKIHKKMEVEWTSR